MVLKYFSLFVVLTIWSQTLAEPLRRRPTSSGDGLSQSIDVSADPSGTALSRNLDSVEYRPVAANGNLGMRSMAAGIRRGSGNRGNRPNFRPRPPSVFRPRPQPIHQPRPHPIPRPRPLPIHQPRPQPIHQPRPQPIPRPRPHPMPRPVPQPSPQIKPQPKPQIQPQPKPQPKPQIQPQPKPQPKPQPNPQPKPQIQPQPKQQPNPHIQPQTKPHPIPQPNPQMQPQPKPQPKPQIQPQPNPHPNPQPKPHPNPQPKLQPKPQPLPQLKPQPDPLPKPQPNNKLNVPVQNNQHLGKDLKPSGPPTNSVKVNHENQKGVVAKADVSHTPGQPPTVSGEVNIKTPGNHEFGAKASVQPGVGGQGSVYGKVNIVDGPKHNLDVNIKHDRPFGKDLKPGPPTNSVKVNYENQNGVGANVGVSHTRGEPGQPITISGGANLKTPGNNEIGANVNIKPGVGGEGSVYGKVNILDGPKHKLDVSVQQDPPLSKDAKPTGQATNSINVNYGNEKGVEGSVGVSRTQGGPLKGNVGVSIPIVSKPDASVKFEAQGTKEEGKKPDYQIGIKGEIKF
ncbi:hypothetical protein PPYR_09914 [Photinus pyralis]|uniref:Attacin C-terminal domain-containing protein n=1 Tax=Photinus pyralis TaxID=7054 RepID=A0A5N4AEV5_PHOPY|nr:circumsporozoite protein-like [Photinus pyralis]KAB0795853.1 hypothetical protein PPYR_09914 [Photinus pyralis]